MCTIRDLKLAVDSLEVALHGVHADEEMLRHLAVGRSRRHHAEDLQLVWSEEAQVLGVLLIAQESLDDDLVEVGSTACDVTDRPDQLVG